jgi:hypothetical protein
LLIAAPRIDQIGTLTDSLIALSAPHPFKQGITVWLAGIVVPEAAVTDYAPPGPFDDAKYDTNALLPHVNALGEDILKRGVVGKMRTACRVPAKRFHHVTHITSTTTFQAYRSVRLPKGAH